MLYHENLIGKNSVQFVARKTGRDKTRTGRTRIDTSSSGPRFVPAPWKKMNCNCFIVEVSNEYFSACLCPIMLFNNFSPRGLDIKILQFSLHSYARVLICLSSFNNYYQSPVTQYDSKISKKTNGKVQQLVTAVFSALKCGIQSHPSAALRVCFPNRLTYSCQTAEQAEISGVEREVRYINYFSRLRSC